MATADDDAPRLQRRAREKRIRRNPPRSDFLVRCGGKAEGLRRRRIHDHDAGEVWVGITTPSGRGGMMAPLTRPSATLSPQAGRGRFKILLPACGEKVARSAG